MVAGKYGLNLACMCWKIWAGSSLKFLEKTWTGKEVVHAVFLSLEKKIIPVCMLIS